MWSGIEPNEESFPTFDLKDPVTSLKRFDNYYKAHFGFKKTMVNSYIKLKTSVLHENPLPNRVVIGKEGWYFLGNHNNELLNDSFGNFKFSEAELETIKDHVHTIRTNLKARGIEFYIVIPPNKDRVYAEKLPYKLQQGKTRLEVLKAYLNKELNFNIIDLRDTLLTNKNNGLLYYKTNTHWNDLGAYIAYQKTLKIIDSERSIPTTHRLEFNLEHQPVDRGDITEMINIESKETGIAFIKKTTSKVEPITSTYGYSHFKNPNGKKKLLMYRDSFANAWIKFFNESFAESIYLRDYTVNYDFIEQQKPDIVIFEIIERNLSAVLLYEKRPPE